MKILFINEVCGITSTGRITCELADKFTAEGHECKIAFGRYDCVPNKWKHYAIRIGTDWDVRVHALKTRLFDTHGFESKRATKRFLEWADKFDPDMIWMHNLHGYYVNVELLFGWIKSRPRMQIKWTLHDCWAYTGHCVYFTMSKCMQWETSCTKCTQMYAYPKSFVKHNVKRNFERKRLAFTNVQNMTLITPSRWLADLVKHSFLKEYAVEVHYNTIDRDIFKPSPSNFREKYGLVDKKIILGVSNVWDERKGLNDFIKLYHLLDEDYTIVLVGLRENQIRQMPSNIVCIAHTNSAQELAEIYSAADVFFNPTYEDNYPTVNLEAEACGTRVITYQTGGAPETIKREDSQVIPVGALSHFIELV